MKSLVFVGRFRDPHPESARVKRVKQVVYDRTLAGGVEALKQDQDGNAGLKRAPLKRPQADLKPRPLGSVCLPADLRFLIK